MILILMLTVPNIVVSGGSFRQCLLLQTIAHRDFHGLLLATTRLDGDCCRWAGDSRTFEALRGGG